MECDVKEEQQDSEEEALLVSMQGKIFNRVWEGGNKKV